MRAVRRIRFAGVVVGLTALVVGAVSAGGPAQAASPKVPATRSGLLWPSGVYVPSALPKDVNAFGTWRKARTDVAVTYSGRSDWADVIDPSWLYSAWAKQTQTLVISSVPYPDSPTNSLADCAAGDYDSYWQQFGANVFASGMASRVIVRLAWEFNGDWNPWAASDPAAFVGCWQHVFTAAESVAPALRWDWTVNRGANPPLLDARAAWPGKKYVDIIGIDSYDGYPAVTNAATWNEQYAGPYGLKFWAAFAKRKGRRLSVPEWGLYPGTAWKGHGGNSPYYIQKMFGFFRQEGSQLAYEAYFDDPDPEHASALSLNPAAAKEYVKEVALSRKR